MSQCCFHGEPGAESPPGVGYEYCLHCCMRLPVCETCNPRDAKCSYCSAGVIASANAFRKAHPVTYDDPTVQNAIGGGAIIDTKYCVNMQVTGHNCEFNRNEMIYYGEKTAAEYISTRPDSMWIRYGNHTVALFAAYGNKTNFRLFSLDQLLARDSAMADRISAALGRICALDEGLGAEIRKQMRDSPADGANPDFVALYDNPRMVTGTYDCGSLSMSASGSSETIFKYMPLTFYTAKHFTIGTAVYVVTNESGTTRHVFKYEKCGDDATMITIYPLGSLRA